MDKTKKSKSFFNLLILNINYIKDKKKETAKEILPIYSSNKSITQNNLRKIIKKFLENFLKYFEENIPHDLVKGYKEIFERAQAIKNIHFPESVQAIEAANLRFATEELLILELGILKNRFIVDSLNTKKYEIEGKKKK